MTIAIANAWWSLVVRGLVAIVLGVAALAWPGITLNVLLILFGAYALIDGCMSLADAWQASKVHERWGALLLKGLAGIAAAVITVAWPAITALALVYVIAFWAVVTGAFEIAAAVRLRKFIAGEWLLALAGIASILFGVLLMAVPLAGALVIALWVGAYTVVLGALLVGLGLEMRAWSREHPGGYAVAR
jgi:uncharacterized membrane protein HdeD (DUF308 family)